MCKYCNVSELDEIKRIWFNEKPVKVRKATIGVEQFSIDMHRHDDTQHWTIDFLHGVGNQDTGEWDDVVKRVQVRYCPFCGDKLADRFNKK